MIDKETYKRELIRMWDSVRTKGKGEKNCFWANCYKCQLFKCCGDVFNAYEAIEAVEKWSKEHQKWEE